MAQLPSQGLTPLLVGLENVDVALRHQVVVLVDD